MEKFCDSCNIFGFTTRFSLIQGSKIAEMYLCPSCKNSYGLGAAPFATRNLNSLFDDKLYNQKIEVRDTAFNETKFDLDKSVLSVAKKVNEH